MRAYYILTSKQGVKSHIAMLVEEQTRIQELHDGGSY